MDITRQLVLAVLVILSTVGALTTASRAPCAEFDDHAGQGSLVHIVPSGSYLITDQMALFMPGIQLDEDIFSAILRAGGEMLYSKIIHRLLHMTMETAHRKLSPSHFFDYMQRGIPLVMNAYYLYYQLPLLLRIWSQGWERTQTMIGWRRRGRMPVFLDAELDKAVFVDYLSQTLEATGSAPWQLDIVPLKPPSLSEQASPWNRTMATLIETALIKNVDLLRLSVDEQGDMTLSWHNLKTGEWLSTELYHEPDHGVFLSQWLEHSWRELELASIHSALELESLTCIINKLNDVHTICLPLNGLYPVSNENQDIVFQASDTEGSVFVRVHDNPHWYVLGEPGYLSVSSSFDNENRAESHQFRMSRSVASVAEFVLNNRLRHIMRKTVGSGIEAVIDWWQEKPTYTYLEQIRGPHISSSIKKLKDQDGRLWIRKEAPVVSNATDVMLFKYAAMANEVLVLEQFDDEHIIKWRDHWLENAGSFVDSKMVTLLEAGEHDLHCYNFQSVDDLKDVNRQVLQGLKVVHDAGFAHNDIKPDNLLRMSDGTIKLIDFGGATKLEWNGYSERPLFTAPFAPPESLASRSGDIWALGISNIHTLLMGNSETAYREMQAAGKSTYSITQGSYLLPAGSYDLSKILSATDSLFSYANRKTKQNISNLIAGRKVLRNIPHYTDFLHQMLLMEPSYRATVDELLQHPFLQQGVEAVVGE